MSDWVDFKAVKEAVSMEQVLDRYGIDLRRVNKTYLRGACPLPTHVGESTNSFGVQTQKDVWACHAASCVAHRDGRKGGNVLDFVALMEDCTIRDAALTLQDWFSVEASNERPENYVPSHNRKKQPVAEGKEQGSGRDTSASPSTPDSESAHGNTPHNPEPTDQSETDPVNPPLGFALKSVDTTHAYLTHRGITRETAEYFGVGHFSGRGSMSGRLVIPIHNERGELVAYAGRSLDNSEPKYSVPTGFHKSAELFNGHRACTGGDSGPVILVEGFFDCMKVHQAGFPCVVALMGAMLSKRQEQLLTEHFDQVIVMLDGDEGGKAATKTVALQLARTMYVRIVDVPDGTQPDRLSSVDLQVLLSFLG